MAVDGRLNFDTKIDTKGFSKGVSSLSDQMNSLIGLAGKLAAALGAALSIKTIVDFGKASVTAATDTTNALQGLQSIISGQGRDFSKATAWVQEYISDGLIPLQNAVTAYKNLAARGYDDDQIQTVLTALKNSAAYGRQSSYSLGEAVQTATEGLKNENSILVDNAGVTKNVSKMWEEYASSIGTTSAKLTQEQKIQAEVNGILTETQYQTEDAAKIAGTFSGQISQLSFNFNELKVSLGNILTNVLQPIVVYLNTAIKQITAFVNASARLLGFTSITASASDNTADLSSNADSASQSYDDMAAAAEAANEANENTLARFDKVNKLGDTNDSTAGTNAALSPTTSSDGLLGNISVKADIDASEVETKLTKLFKDIKSNLEKLFDPLKLAWSKNGKKVTDSLKYAFKEIFGLAKEIGKSFGEVWTNGTGEKTVGHILQIFRNINSTIGNIAGNLKKAWTKDNLGTDIVQNVADIFNTILRHNENISKKISDWSGELDFSPALTALRDLSAALEPFTDTIGEGLETFFDEVLLPLGKWTIEDLIPTFLETLADVITGLQKVWKTASPVIKDKLWDGFLKPIAKWTADKALSSLSTLGDLFKKLCDNMTEKDVAVLLDLAGAISAIYAAVKGKQKLDDFNLALKTMKKNAEGALTKLREVWALANVPLTTPKVKPSDSTAIVPSFGIPNGTATQAGEAGATAGLSFATKFCAAVAAFFVGWEIGTAIRDAIGGDKIDEALFPIFDAIVKFFTVTIPEWWDTLQEDTLFPIYDKAVAAWNAVITFFTESIPAFFTETIPSWWSSWTEDLMFPIYDKAVAAWDAVVTFFTESIPTFFTQTVPQWFSDLWTAIKSVFKNTGEWFGNKFETAWKNIKSAFSLSSVGSFFSGIWGGIKSAFGNVTKWFKDTFTEAWQGVKNVFSVGGKIFSGIKEGISEVFTDTVNKIIDGLNIVIAAPFNAINDAIGWVRDLEIAGWNPFSDLSEISVPQIPKLATGTVVPANYGEFLAVLGDNRRETEVVSPLSTIEQAVERVMARHGGADGDIVIYLQMDVDGNKLHRQIVRVNKAQIRKTGHNPLAT